MTATAPDDTENHGSDAEFFDVVIVGAGISGIGAAYRIAERNLGLRYVILERRDQIGGTWDLFRYPGVRSDSSIFTLSFPWEPWTRKEGVADGDDIRDYLNATAHKHGIDTHIRFGSRVRSADWDSTTDTWTVQVDQNGVTPRPTAPGSCSSAAATTTTTRATLRTSRASRNFQRHAGASAVLARGPRLLRQERGGDRQRRHRDHPGAGAGPHAGKVDHAAALPHLRQPGAPDRSGRPKPVRKVSAAEGFSQIRAVAQRAHRRLRLVSVAGSCRRSPRE